MKTSREELLVISAQAGNEEALTELYRQFYQPLLKFAYKLCGHHDWAQDAVQDVWLDAAKKLLKLNDPKAFRSWMYRAVRWRCIDIARKANKTEQMSESEVVVPTEQLQVVDSGLLRLIQELPEVERQAIYLFYLEEFSLVEISIVLEVPQGTVKSRLNRARKNLKVLLTN
ncbi:RNA polymerase sigma factor [Kangiella sp. HZ709]|uniref:RNA polymerase sigma factor n=1 Tax=Kangiella sp. HZ709 TaxID=2666328 RepID=UPI0012B03CA8|nr:RNA polymerase sigma factor [Kangiella sp. HZ709]MRX27908.1 sigma-70 family RNA polymerase sigma factor [Kangiella sp. HZ709]